MVVARFPPYLGGCEINAFHLSRKLAQQGTRVSVLTQRFSTETPEHQSSDGIDIHRLAFGAHAKPWESAVFIKEAVRVLRVLKPDVTHAHMLSSPAVAAAAAKQLWGIPAIALGTGIGPIGEVGMARNSWVRRLKLRYLVNHLDAVIATTSLMKQEFVECGFHPERIRVIPNGVDQERFRPVDAAAKMNARRRLNLPSGALVVIYTGRIAPEKGVDVLLNAWSRWKKPPETVLLVVGDGPEAPKLKKMADSTVRWIGEVADVENYLPAADILVLPSRGESFSYSLLEAMASGVACIATQAGGPSEVLNGGERGLLVPPENPEALARAMNDIASQSALRERLIFAGRRAVEEHFSLQTATRTYLKLYEELASSAPR